MLVLTRRPGEGIIIGDDIRVTVIEIKGGGIRIGIEAPSDMKIFRQEIYDRIGQENKEASQWNLTDLDMVSSGLPPPKDPK